MAKDKKDLDKLNNFNVDPFDFGSFDDFGFESHAQLDDRNPVGKIRGHFKRGLTRKLEDSSFQKEILRRSLPKEYETGFELYDTLDYSFRELNEKVKRELKPGLQELRNLSRKVFPGKIPLVPEKLYKKYNDWLDQKEYRGESQQDRDEAMTSMMLGEVFSNQSKIQEAERQEDIVREEIKSLTEKKRFEVSHIERVRTNSLLASLVNYQDKVTTSYSRRMLELQFKSYLTQVRLLEAVKATGEKTNAELEAITKNTGLPDFVKLRNVEAVKELTRRKLIETALNSSAAGRITGLGKRLLENLSKNVTSSAGFASFGIGTLSSLGDMTGDDGPAPKNFKEVMQRGAESGAEHILPYILGHYLGKGADRVRDYIGDGKDPGSIRHRINRGAGLIDYYIGSADQHLQNRIRNGKGEFLDTLLSMADAEKEVFRSRSGLTGFQYGADRFGGGLGNTGTTIATEEVIPGWLQRIWGELYMARTGENHYVPEIYDQKHKKFTKVSHSAYGIGEKFKRDFNRDYIDKEIARIIVNLTGNRNLSDKAKQALAKKIRLDAIEGITPTPESYRFLKDIPKDVGLEIRKAIESHYGYDPITDSMKTTEGDALDRRRSIFKSSKGIMSQFGPAHEEALKLIDEGKLDSLRLLGLVKETQNGLSFDYGRYVDLLDEGYDFSSLNLEGVSAKGNLRSRYSRTRTRYRTEHAIGNYYLMGEEVPSIYENRLREGRYIDSFTGKPITDITKIKGDVLDENGKVVLPHSALSRGLYDEDGNKVVIGFDAGYEASKRLNRSWSLKARAKAADLKKKAGATVSGIRDKVIDRDIYSLDGVTPILRKAKIDAGEYFDSVTGKVIRSYSDIKGAVVDRYNNIVVSEFELSKGMFDEYGNKISDIASSIKESVSSINIKGYGNKAKSYGTKASASARELLGKTRDLFVPGELRPRIKKAKLEAGEYFDAITGKVIKSFNDIKGPVMDKYQNEIVSAEEIKKGLTDAMGNKVVSSILDTASAIKDKSSISPENRAKIRKAYNETVSKVSGKAYDGPSSKVSATEKLLQDIYQLLNFRQPGNPDSHLKRTKTGDLDGDGIRDGSWQDILRRRRSKKSDGKDPDGKGTKKSGEEEKKSGGIISSLMNLLGLGSLGRMGIGALGKVAGGVLGGILGKGVLGAAKLALRAAMNPVGTALSAGKFLGRHAYKGAGALVKGGARALPTVAKGLGRAALWGARLAVPFMMSPIGLAVTGVALLAYGGYKLYQHRQKVKDERSSYLTYLRMVQYGVDPEDKEQIEKLLMLEEMREKDFVRPGEERPYKDPESFEEIRKIFFTWGADPSNEMHQVRVADWYNHRGGPVMSVWSNALYMLKGYHKLSDIDKLNPTEKQELLKMVSIPADDPYSAVNFPMIPKDGNEAAAQTGEDVEKYYEKAVKIAEEEVGLQYELLKDQKKPMSRKEARRRRQNKALLEKEAREKYLREEEGIRDYGFGVMKGSTGTSKREPITDLSGFSSLVDDMLNKDYESGWTWPVRQGTISSEFGTRIHPVTGERKPHHGVDIAAPEGTPIYAAANGEVTVKGHLRGYGNAIYIKHKDGKVSRYAHMAAFAEGIEVGTQVLRGQLIGYVGSTGVSTGPHLHFEIRDGESNTSSAINPVDLINDEFKRDQIRVTNLKKQEAGNAPEGYDREEGADLEGKDTIVSTAKPNANPVLEKDVPLMLKRDYVSKSKIQNQPTRNPDSPITYNKDKSEMAFNADMLDISREQVSGIGRVGEGIQGMTSEQRAANETLNRIATALENQGEKTAPTFRRHNQGISNPTVGQRETLDSMYSLARQNNLDPRNYMTEEQISRVSPGIKTSSPTQLGRTSAIMTH